MSNIYLSDVKISFFEASVTYSQPDPNKAEVRALITPLSRFSYAKEAVHSLKYLIGSVALVALGAITALAVLVYERKRPDMDFIAWMLRQPVVAAMMIPLSITGILFPKAINERVLGLYETITVSSYPSKADLTWLDEEKKTFPNASLRPRGLAFVKGGHERPLFITFDVNTRA